MSNAYNIVNALLKAILFAKYCAPDITKWWPANKDDKKPYQACNLFYLYVFKFF